MKKYILLVLILIIFNGCKNEPFNLNDNYAIYAGIGKDPIIITDPFYKPSNKNLIYLYPKESIIYEQIDYANNINGLEDSKIKYRIYYKIIDPMDFYLNKMTINEVGRELSWKTRECMENYFINKTKSEIHKIIIDNKYNKDLLNLVIKELSKGDMFDDPIKGIQLENIKIMIYQKDF